MYQWSAVGARATYTDTVRSGFGLAPPTVEAFLCAAVSSTKAGLLTDTTSASTRSHYLLYNSNGLVGSITTNGSATAFNTTSDGRLKVNREDISVEMDIGALIDALEPKAYDLLSGVTGEPTGERGYGLIAQDVLPIVPSAVSEGTGTLGADDFKPWGMDYSKLVVFLLAEIKSLRGRVAALEGGQ
jgi:YD repeat-containing protein